MYELITLNNQFLGLDVLEEENEILKLTGFSGSNATLLKGKEKSYLFTDKRYELQAKQEIKDPNIEIIFAAYDYWIANNIKDKVYYNPWCHSITVENRFKEIGKNFIAKAKEPRYYIDKCPFEYSVEYAGSPASEKVFNILELIKTEDLDAYIITNATNASWLLNLRSSVLPYSPVYRTFAAVNKKGEVHLFNHPKQIKKYKKVGFSELETPAIFAKYFKNYKYLHAPTWKQRFSKSEVEVEGFKNAHIKDGVAITKLLYWLYNDNAKKTEADVASKLQELRESQDDYFKPSFASIVAYGKNSALPHYQPTENRSDNVGKGMLLIDVGAHYFGGTTDMTRTIHLGKATKEQKKHYTLVLKGHIDLAMQKFPYATTGKLIDILARSPLLNEGLDYEHGTGHGVGNFLCVHEGPSISKKGFKPIYENIITSIEPAVYFEDKYGIRIENLYRTKKEESGFLSFENLTFVPLDNSLIDINSLSEAQKKFVFEYQKNVYKKLENFLDEKEKSWLRSYISFNVINSKS